MRYFITFSYDGTNYHGLEKQKKYHTIQEEMEKTLKFINNQTATKLVCSGRTDKGVHAKGQTAHADINVEITPEKLKRAMNSLLPKDIHVLKTEIVDKDFHARYMIKEKVYEYYINTGEYDPLKRNYIYQFNKKLDIEIIKEAIKDFVGVHNFKAFTETKEKRENYVREITKAQVLTVGDIIIFKFQGNGFLKYQIRNMVGLLIQIGLHKKKPACVKEILKSQNRSQGFPKAHPEGLYLVKVIY